MRIASLLMLILLIVLVGCGAADTPATATADLQISLRFDPDPPTVGASTVIITLVNASGSPVDDATLAVHGDMEHEGMASVDREVTESTNGEYRVPFEWSMGGAWVIMVTATLPNGGETVETFETFVEAVSSESIIRQPTPTP